MVKRWRRIFLKLGLVLVAVVLAAAAALFLLLPGHVEAELKRQLAVLGLPGVELSVEFIGLDQITLRDLSLPDSDALQISSLTAHYTLEGLWQGHVDEVVVDGAAVTIAVRDGAVDWGALGQIRLAGTGGFPFDSVRLTRATCRLALPETTLVLPAEVTCTVQGSDGLDIALTSETGLQADATLDLADWTGSLTASMKKLDLQRARELCRSVADLPIPPLQGFADIVAAAEVDDSQISATLEASGDGLQVAVDLAGQQQVAFVGSMQTRVQTGRQAPGKRLQSTFALNGVSLQGLVDASPVDLAGTVRLSEEEIVAEVSLGGDELNLNAEAFGRKVAATLGPSSLHLTAERSRPAESVHGGVRFSLPSLSEDVSGVRVADLAGEVPFRWGASEEAPRLSMGALHLRSARLGEQQFDEVDLQVRVEEAELLFLAETTLVEGLRLYASGGLRLEDGQPVGAAQFSSPAFEITDPEALAKRIPDLAAWRVHGQSGGLTGSATLQGDDWRWNMRMDLDGMHLSHEAYGLQLSSSGGVVQMDSTESGSALPKVRLWNVDAVDVANDIHVDGLSGGLQLYPTREAAAKSPFGEFTAKRLRFGEHGVPDIGARVRLSLDRLVFEATTPIVDKAVLTATGWADWGSDPLRMEAKLSAPAFSLTDAEELSRRVPPLSAWRVAGDIGGVDGHVRMTGDQFSWGLQAKLDGVGVINRVWDMEVRGLRGLLSVDSTESMIGEEWQTLTASEARFGVLRLNEASGRYRGTEKGMLIDHAACTWAGGRIEVRQQPLDFALGRAEVTFLLKQIDLGQALRFLAAGRATAAGSLSGQWTIRPIWLPEPDIEFGAGVLQSETKDGWFLLESEEGAAELKNLNVKEGPAIGSREELMARIQRALTDFAFTDLKIEFRELPERALATHVHLVGEGPRGPQPLSFGGLTFNVTGLDRLLRTLMVRTHEAKAQMQDRVRQALEGMVGSSDEPPPEDREKRKAENRAIEEFF